MAITIFIKGANEVRAVLSASLPSPSVNPSVPDEPFCDDLEANFVPVKPEDEEDDYAVPANCQLLPNKDKEKYKIELVQSKTPSASGGGAGVKTLGDVRRLLEAMKPENVPNRLLILSSISTVSRAFGGSPDDLPADPREIRKRLSTLSPAMVGLTKGSWASVRSRLQAALRLADVAVMPRRKGKLSPSWQLLSDKLPECGAWKISLSRFFGFCSERGIAPESMCDPIAERFFVELDETGMRGKPQTVYREAIKAWNFAVKQVDDWPQVHLTLPNIGREGYVFPASQFSCTFQASIAAHIDFLADPPEEDIFAPIRGLRPASLTGREFALRQMGSVLVHMGVEIGSLQTIADLPSRENMQRVYNFYKERFGREATSSVKYLLRVMQSLARRQLHDEQLAVVIGRRIAKLFGRQRRGITEKNRRRLAVFNDPKLVRRILLLPLALCKRATTMTDKKKAAILMRNAVAIELELMCPLRLSNLANLSVEHNLIGMKAGKAAKARIFVPGETVKNEQEIEMELPDQSADLLEIYLTGYRHFLINKEHRSQLPRFIFPKPNGSPKCGKTLGESVCETLEAELGIKFHMHLFRHLACFLYLRRNPEGFETMRRVLGHKSLDTTVRFYAEIQQSLAFKLFDRVVLDHRAGLPAAKKVPKAEPAFPKPTKPKTPAPASVGRPKDFLPPEAIDGL